MIFLVSWLTFLVGVWLGHNWGRRQVENKALEAGVGEIYSTLAVRKFRFVRRQS